MDADRQDILSKYVALHNTERTFMKKMKRGKGRIEIKNSQNVHVKGHNISIIFGFHFIM